MSHCRWHRGDEVLEAIRVGSGEIPRLKKKFDLRKTLTTIIELHLAKSAQKKLSLTLEFDPNIPTYLVGDKIRIHRIALELISNALNFTDRGFVKLTALLAKKENRELIIKLIAEDSGIGIPKEKQHEIYVQFKKLTPSYKGIYKGAGLGLSVVKQFIDELDGEIYLESEPRKGSRFTCVIPLKEALLDESLGLDDEMDREIDIHYEKTYAEEIKPLRIHHPGLPRVLVVEDNAIAQTIAKSILNQLNCTTDIADNGKKAVEMWKTKEYDLIFMDIGLPDIDGYEVTHLIRIQELPKKTHIPIIALTAHAGDENKKRCIDAGMNAVMTKPLTAKSCADIVDAFIPGRGKDDVSPFALSLQANLPDNDNDLFDLSEFPFLDLQEGINTTGNEEMLAEMLAIMIGGELQSDLEQMKLAFNTKDWEKTQQLAHKIKGGAVYVGTVKMKIACQYLERYWKEGQRDLFEPLYEQTTQVIETTIDAVHQWLVKRVS